MYLGIGTASCTRKLLFAFIAVYIASVYFVRAAKLQFFIHQANFLILDLGGLAAPQIPRLGNFPCAQARGDRTAREHEARLAGNIMSNHTDMQDKYFSHCCDNRPIQNQYKQNHKRDGAAESRATAFVVAADSTAVNFVYSL